MRAKKAQQIHDCVVKKLLLFGESLERKEEFDGLTLAVVNQSEKGKMAVENNMNQCLPGSSLPELPRTILQTRVQITRFFSVCYRTLTV